MFGFLYFVSNTLTSPEQQLRIMVTVVNVNNSKQCSECFYKGRGKRTVGDVTVIEANEVCTLVTTHRSGVDVGSGAKHHVHRVLMALLGRPVKRRLKTV